MKKRLAVVVAFAALVAACGDDTPAADDQPTGEDTPAADTTGAQESDTTEPAATGDQPTINLVVNPWSASRLNVEVAKNLIENELGYPVEITEVNENDAMFTGLSDGTLDAALEIWPSGVTDAENAYFDDGSVTNLGPLGAVGKIGWFVPSYVIADHPELATWEGYQTADAAALFATAETGDQGRFLGTDPSYSQFDEQIITNLALPFEVQFSGSEPATVAELDARVVRRGTDPHVLVDTDCGGRQVRPRERRPACLYRRVRGGRGRCRWRCRLRLPGGRPVQGCIRAAPGQGPRRVRVPREVHDHDR